MNELKLGQEITITSILKRKEEYLNTLTPIPMRKKYWDEVKLKEPKNGIIVGKRTLSNGRTDYDTEAGYLYEPEEHFAALLVVTNLNENPFYVKI